MSKDFSTFLKTHSKQRLGTIASGILLLIAAVILGLFFLFSNLRLANRLKHSVVQLPESNTQDPKLKT